MNAFTMAALLDATETGPGVSRVWTGSKTNFDSASRGSVTWTRGEKFGARGDGDQGYGRGPTRSEIGPSRRWARRRWAADSALRSHG